MTTTGSRIVVRTVIVVAAAGMWFAPPPAGLSVAAWRLFALFAAAIASVVFNAFPILTASVLAVAAAVLTNLLPAEKAYSGFANGTILLIVLAFLVARSVIKCGLGTRIGHVMVSLFGRSALGLSYSIFLVDGLIAPAFPSNTARSGVIYPMAFSLAEAAGARPGVESRNRLGSFLMFSGIASLSLSSALWLTAMAANPLGAEIARARGVQIGFGSWLIAASVPTLVGIVLMPLLLRWLIGPSRTPRPKLRPPPAAHWPLSARFGGTRRSCWRSSWAWSRYGDQLQHWDSIRPPSPFSASVAPGVRRPDARGHRERGRRARHVHLVRRAVHVEQ
jgi:DASS family divalent anion:Na+ symporter